MPRNKDIKKVLVIGSGPIIIGQAAEFDYAGTQACRSLKEEGIEVVLLNSNPATIMTDKDIADRVYIEPLTVEVVEQLILKEKPDSVLPTLGGQAGLNLAMELDEKGFLKEHNIRLIGTTAQTIKKAEDRQEFKDTMEKIGEPIAASKVVTTVEDGLAFTNTIGYPVVLRPAYTLGGSGGGIAHNEYELREILENGLRLSRVGEVLVERCIAGWKEIEYEVMRDSAGNCITVCNMENIDPVGVHTGDSIVVAPSQTLGDKEYQMLRTSALNIITELGITGGCNVQYALKPDSFEYCVIEVNPRVSRSSALASKATGYPIAKVAAKIALGYTLDEIPNAITGKTYASFEPMLDYCVVKIPRLPFDKFITAKRTLTTQMKATGEVMSICHNFEGALMKAIRSLEQHVDSLMSYDFTQLTDEELLAELEIVDDRRIWKIAEAIRRGMPQSMLHDITKIDIWFIDKIAILVGMENALKTRKLTKELLLEAKRMEFPDYIVARLAGKTEEEIKALREEYQIKAAYKMVDTCAAEFAAATPYYYSVYGDEGTENEAVATPDKKKIIIMAVQLKKAGYVENARSTHRSFAKKLIENGNADAAFIAFYTEGDPKWRLSLVRLDYEMKIENGRLKTAENLTPAKRYSYLVGQDEPCHTAISQFERFITDSAANPERPTLNDLENAFSVEKVTDEFFNLYCEKFHQLREQLEAIEDFRIEAEQHNFTSAQFAKKLMGQIVFLYFLSVLGQTPSLRRNTRMPSMPVVLSHAN